MPLPVLLPILGAGALLLGAGGHISAKENNAQAQSISEDARSLYNSAKNSLEKSKEQTEQALLKLGYDKKNVLDTSMKQFLDSYEKVKAVAVQSSTGLNELSHFTINQQDTIQLREMTDIYSSSISSGATGAAAGAIIALAASGDLILVTDGLALAGSALAMGEVGAAAGIAGSALSFGAAMTPLAAIAAPVVLFTGISASIKADENLEKARTMYAEAKAASEKMKTSETICHAISERSNLFDNTLKELDGLFSRSTNLLQDVLAKKEMRLRRRKFTSDDFSENDLKLIAVTRALAGAVKAIIDTPILDSDGDLDSKSQDVYDTTVQDIPKLSNAVIEVESLDYNDYPVMEQEFSQQPMNYRQPVTYQNSVPTYKGYNKPSTMPEILKIVMWIMCSWPIVAGVLLLIGGAFLTAIFFIAGGVMMCPEIFKKLKFLPRLGILALCFIIGVFLI